VKNAPPICKACEHWRPVCRARDERAPCDEHFRDKTCAGSTCASFKRDWHWAHRPIPPPTPQRTKP